VGRTGETGRAFGIDFLAVLYRGSQYRVESLMARLAHSQNYLLPSPSKEQVGSGLGYPHGPLWQPEALHRFSGVTSTALLSSGSAEFVQWCSAAAICI
jgi:hypothetical protein